MKNPADRIRITFVLPSLAFGGGIEGHLIKMLRFIDRSRFECSVITLFNYPDRPDLYDQVPDDVRVIRLGSRGIAHLSTWIAMVRTFRLIRPHVVVGSMFSPNAIIRILKPLFGYAVVTREHNTYDEKRWYHRFADRVLASLSDAIVAVSSDVAVFASAQSGVPLERFTVINNGVDTEAIDAFIHERGADESSRVRKELRLHDDEKIILNVARIKPTKGHALLVEGFRRFMIAHPEYHLAIVSDGSERSVVETMIRDLGIGDRVHLLGYRKDVFAWYAAADMFVLSSKREGFPNVGIEAMAFGLPFIATPVSGVRDIIEEGKNGFIIEPNEDALAAALYRIATLSPEERVAMREACHANALRFDIRIIIRRYEDLFEHVSHA